MSVTEKDNHCDVLFTFLRQCFVGLYNYGTERICHTCNIFGPIRHTFQRIWNMCHIPLDLVFLCLLKRICHLNCA